jgi:hypothetical protein
MVMPPKTANNKNAGIITDFRRRKQALPAGTGHQEALTGHRAAQASLEALGNTLAETRDPDPAWMRDTLDRATSLVRIRLENRQAVASRMADAHVVLEMSEFVRRQILSQRRLAGLSRMENLALHLARCES